MTEAEWNTCADPRVMLDYLRDSDKLSERKARLFAVAVCRRIWPALTDARSRRAVEIAERFADGQATAAELDEASAAAGRAAGEVRWDHAREAAGGTTCRLMSVEVDEDAGQDMGLMRALDFAAREVSRGGEVRKAAAERQAQADLLRCAFNPFRPPPPIEPAWLAPAVVSVARRAYEGRDFAALPVLADALEEAGCTNAALLSHCRGPGPHARGCWALDLLLGKS